MALNIYLWEIQRNRRANFSWWNSCHRRWRWGKYFFKNWNFCFVILLVEPKFSQMLGKHSTYKLHFPVQCSFFFFFWLCLDVVNKLRQIGSTTQDWAWVHALLLTMHIARCSKSETSHFHQDGPHTWFIQRSKSLLLATRW